MPRVSISIDKEVHNEVTNHLKSDDRKIGRFAESALKEKIEKEKVENEKKKSKK